MKQNTTFATLLSKDLREILPTTAEVGVYFDIDLQVDTVNIHTPTMSLYVNDKELIKVSLQNHNSLDNHQEWRNHISYSEILEEVIRLVKIG